MNYDESLLCFVRRKEVLKTFAKYVSQQLERGKWEEISAIFPGDFLTSN